MCLRNKGIYHIILGVSLAFTSGFLFTISNALVDYLKLYSNECMFTRYSLQVVTFLTVVISLNVKTTKDGQTSKNNSEQKGLLINSHKTEKISLWIYAVDADKNIHIIRAILIFQGLCGALNSLGWYVSVILMPLGDASAIIFSAPLPTMVISKIALGTRLKLYKICCGLFVMLGIILVVQPPAIFSHQYHTRQELVIGSTESNESTKMVLNGTIFICNETKTNFAVTHERGYYYGALAAAVASIARGFNNVMLSYLYTNKSTKSASLMGLYTGFGGLLIAFVALPFHTNDFSRYSSNDDVLSLIGLIGVAIFAVAAVFMLNKSVQLIGSILESFIRTSDVIMAYLIQVVFLYEPISYLSLTGTLCIIFAIVLISAEEALINNLPDNFLKNIL